MNSNLFWCVMGIIGSTVFSLIISLLFYLKSKKRKRLTYEIKTTSIISNKIQQVKGLEVKYKSSEIENLYCSTITIKNIGNSIVKKQDLVPSCPIHILTSGQFLNAEPYCIEASPQDRTTAYSLSEQEIDGICKYIEFVFDYIPQKAIITYSLFHTGKIKFEGDLMDGKIIAVDIPKNNFKKTYPEQSLLMPNLFGGIGALASALIAALIDLLFN